MATPANGTVVLVRFPFSDLSGSKLRPAIVLAQAGKGDIVLCQITSQRYTDATAIELLDSDLKSGSLNRTSYLRPGKLFTANETIVAKTIGKVSHEKLVSILDAVVALFEASK